VVAGLGCPLNRTVTVTVSGLIPVTAFCAVLEELRSQRARERSIRRFIHLFMSLTIRSGLFDDAIPLSVGPSINTRAFSSQVLCQPPADSCVINFYNFL
jgi:hypothetical protein